MIIKLNEVNDKEYQDFVKKCQANATYKKIKSICNKYGYNRISDTIYVGKDGNVKYFNISSDDKLLPKLHYQHSSRSHTIDTSGWGDMTLEEFQKLINGYSSTVKMLQELAKIDLDKLYHIE